MATGIALMMVSGCEVCLIVSHTHTFLKKTVSSMSFKVAVSQPAGRLKTLNDRRSVRTGYVRLCAFNVPKGDDKDMAKA